ncbi:MAG TPA: DUF1284 domain-containing protein [Bdellovibrionota bacterium]|nr:DUF1284 domain-containing protein [Bdellovibrionota bacterium]
MKLIQIRAHNLLCIQGFVGLGYSESFIASMKKIVEELNGNPETPVKVIATPDHLCTSCPNLKSDGCNLRGAGHERNIRAQDLKVCRILKIKSGTVLPWEEILHCIAQSVKGSDLRNICQSCPWLSFGVCAKGIDRLQPTPQS